MFSVTSNAMPILDIKHVTTYRYNRPVSFGEHRMMLLPRDDEDQKVLKCEIDIRPKPVRLDWSRDVFGNHVATAKFNDRSDKLSFVSRVRLEHAPVKFHAADIDYSARRYPFAYSVDEWAALNRYMEPPAPRNELDRWSAAFFKNGKSIGLHELLVSMTQTIKRTIEHVSRHEEGIQDPVQTLDLKSGSCRDVAVLMIAALRSRGIAARFVSGYVQLVDDDDEDDVDKVVREDDIAGGNTHAWVQVYVPGPGWVDFDPAAGAIGNQNLIRVAAVQHPGEAIPLQGTWYGSPTDHLAMNVAVRVRAVDPEVA
jgi:transglutaminase-like putative cysteine protease